MNILTIILVGIAGFGVLSQYQTNKYSKNTETPRYELIEVYQEIEIRAYPQMVLATTIMGTGKYSNSSSKGFRTVADYIFGGNDQNKKISMTAPVLASMGDTMQMSFIMPAKYSIDELPEPYNDDVNLNVQPKRTLAVISFGGFANDRKIQLYTELLKNKLDEEGISYSDQVFFHGYNPPFQLFNRTNEVAIVLDNYEK